MGIVYNRYINGQDHTWYDSSNVLYSLCYDIPSANKNLKVIFKQGRTYLYKDVDVNDYLMFKNASSNGEAINKYIIKKYKALREQDTDLDKLNELKESFINENKETDKAFTNLAYHIDYDDMSGEFLLKLNNRILFHGYENQVSIINLFKSMNIKYSMSEFDFSKENNNAIIKNNGE